MPPGEHVTPFVANRRAALVLVVVLFVVVFAVRFATTSVADATSLLYVLPVALAGVVFGAGAGLVAAITAIGLLTLWAGATGADLTVLGWVSRSTVMVVLGVLIGVTSDRLRAGENRFRRSFENLLDPFVILKPVRDDADEIVAFATSFANAAAAHAPRVPVLFDAYRRVVETGVPLALDEVVHDDAILDIRAIPVDDGLACTWRDVTARVEADLALAEQARRLLEAQSLAGLAWWEWDRATPNRLAASPALSEMLGEPLVDGAVAVDALESHLDPEEWRALCNAARHAVDDRGRFEHDVPLAMSRRWLHVRGESTGDGRLRGTVQDVSELRRAEEVRRDFVLAVARHRDAIEINDSIVQALSVAKWMLEAGKAERGLDAVADALETAQHLVADLFDDNLHADDLTRSRPVRGGNRSAG